MLTLLVVAALVASASIDARAQAQAIPPWREPLVAPPPEVSITVGDEPLTVQVVDTVPYTSLGLGYRNGLDPATGMLFVFDDASPQSFWMKGMRFCLDIVWIEGGQIVGAAENVCPDPPGTADEDRPSYVSPEPVTYVLEVPGGWLDEHGFDEGTPVDLSNLPSTAVR